MDYTEPLIWDGDENCEHRWEEHLPEHHPGQVEQTKLKNASGAGKGQTVSTGQFCSKCGAWRGSLGLELTFDLYIKHLRSRDKGPGTAEVTRLQGALRYAIAVIENYRLDIRNSKDSIRQLKKLPPLSDLGFCQETFYTEALDTIERIKKGEIPSPFGLKLIEGESRIPGQYRKDKNREVKL